MKIGIQELLVVFIVALIFVGPDKLPYYAKKLGQAFGQFRKYTEEATKDIRESIVEPLNEAQKPLREAMEPVTEMEKDIQNNVKDIKKSISDIGRPAPRERADAPKNPDQPITVSDTTKATDDRCEVPEQPQVMPDAAKVSVETPGQNTGDKDVRSALQPE